MTLLILGCKYSASKQHTGINTSQFNTNDKEKLGTLIALRDSEIGIPSLILSLNNNLPVESERVGFVGEKSTTYANYKTLARISNDSLLLNLTRHSNPKIRIYAMWSLASKNKSLALSQLDRISHDKEMIVYHSGCLTIPSSVDEMVSIVIGSTEFAKQ
jgi:hypothetical protein